MPKITGALQRMFDGGRGAEDQLCHLRVEHWNEFGRHPLAWVEHETASPYLLTPYLAQLLLNGATGDVVLIDERSGAEIARRSLAFPVASDDTSELSPPYLLPDSAPIPPLT